VRGRGRGCGSEIHKIRRKNKERSREEKWCEERRRRGDDVCAGITCSLNAVSVIGYGRRAVMEACLITSPKLEWKEVSAWCSSELKGRSFVAILCKF
jgi:hypothetical protein